VFGNSMFQVGMYTDDCEDYWTVLDAQHDRYRRSLRFLVVAAIVLGVLAIVVHPALAGAALALVPIIVVHIVLVRHSRTRVKIPDHRR
jgi:Ca2+/Na+ antiporter